MLILCLMKVSWEFISIWLLILEANENVFNLFTSASALNFKLLSKLINSKIKSQILTHLLHNFVALIYYLLFLRLTKTNITRTRHVEALEVMKSTCIAVIVFENLCLLLSVPKFFIHIKQQWLILNYLRKLVLDRWIKTRVWDAYLFISLTVNANHSKMIYQHLLVFTVTSAQFHVKIEKKIYFFRHISGYGRLFWHIKLYSLVVREV